MKYGLRNYILSPYFVFFNRFVILDWFAGFAVNEAVRYEASLNDGLWVIRIHALWVLGQIEGPGVDQCENEDLNKAPAIFYNHSALAVA